jgi:ABC-type dipeptide/oligopeptide/nickel transport system ATPase component
MLDALRHRTLIIGNSGSGKSTVGAQVAAFSRCSHIDLDHIYWEDQALLKKRVAPLAAAMIASVSLTPVWVVEGVYSWLVDVAAPRATVLIWLDVPWSECKAGLEGRGPVSGISDPEFNGLLTWAENYWVRQTPSSHAGHQKIFDAFCGEKRAMTSRAEVVAFANGLMG